MATGSSRFSSTSFLTADDSGASDLDTAGRAASGAEGWGASGAEGRAACTAVASGPGAAGLCRFSLAAAAPPPAITPSTAPISTLAPSPTRISPSVPASGALTSTVTLSVSSSTTGSSTSTASPTDLSHRPTVASVIDSPRAGTVISAVMTISFARRLRVRRRPAAARDESMPRAFSPHSVSASSTSFLCPSSCLASRPDAGAAASSRPT